MDTRKNLAAPRSPSGIPAEIFEAQMRMQQEQSQPFSVDVISLDSPGHPQQAIQQQQQFLSDNGANSHTRTPSPNQSHHHRRSEVAARHKVKSPGYYPFKKEGSGSFRKIGYNSFTHILHLLLLFLLLLLRINLGLFTDEKDVVYRPHDSINLGKEEVNEKMWQLMSTYLRKDVPTIQRHIVNHIEYTLARTRYNFDNFASYQATALSIRDRLIESWNDTQQYFTIKNITRVYYLSMEFLMGRSLQNAIINMGLKDAYTEALNKMGHTLEELYDEEKDAALGNGGLGRLAACFMDSLATMDYPAWGYGIRFAAAAAASSSSSASSPI